MGLDFPWAVVIPILKISQKRKIQEEIGEVIIAQIEEIDDGFSVVVNTVDGRTMSAQIRKEENRYLDVLEALDTLCAAVRYG